MFFSLFPWSLSTTSVMTCNLHVTPPVCKKTRQKSHPKRNVTRGIKRRCFKQSFNLQVIYTFNTLKQKNMVPIASPFVHYRIQRPRDSCGRTARIPQRLRSKSCPLISPPGILCPVKLESGGVCCSLFFVFCCLLFVVGYCCSLIVFVVF